MNLLELNGLTPDDLKPHDRVGELEVKQQDYEDETDAALFDIVEYIASLEARIEALEA